MDVNNIREIMPDAAFVGDMTAVSTLKRGTIRESYAPVTGSSI
jgi:hypothetical protein